MGYKGVEQFLCPEGHLTEIDAAKLSYAYEEERKKLLICPHCQQKFVLNCSVDFTNGSCEEYPETTRGKVKEIGFIDIWHNDHYGNRYATKLMKYEPEDPKRWEKMEQSR